MPKKRILAFAVSLALGGAVEAGAQTISATALPAGGTVVGGQAAIATQGAAMTVEQASARAAIDWQSFNIGSQASVTFHQPSASAIALNRVLGSSGSEIYGRLSANGQVFLLNPNGVLFGRGAQVDVGSLLASPIDLSPADFMAGRYNLSGGGSGSVVNRGSIRTAPGGYAALIAPSVLNEGTIDSPGGNVTLAAASAATLDFMADGLVRIRVDRGALAAEVANHGVITADGGAVLLKAESLDALAPSVVNMTGIIEAQTVEQADGVVRLGSVELRADRVDVSSEARIEGSSIIAWGTDVAHVHGTLTARGAGGSGGFIETSGHVLDVDGIRIDAGNGGQWLLDPWDLTISNNADVAVSGTDAIGTLSNLNASVIQRALDGGTSVTVTTGAQGTETGNITVFGTADQGGAVNIAMTGSGNATLTLQAAGSIDIRSGAKFTSSLGALSLVLNSGNDNGGATGSGAINIDGATIATNGGDVVMGGGTSPLTGAAIGTQALVNGKQVLDGVHIGGNTTIATGAGSVTINGRGASDANNARGVLIDGNSRITVDGGSVSITGTGGTGGASNTGNEGVRIEGAIVESGSGAGTIKISGTGGSGSDVHTGVRIASAAVRTVDASISINGVGGGTRDSNSGVLLDGGSLVETAGLGVIDIVGTSGAGANRNFGISLENSTVRSTASGTGGISLDGTSIGRGAPNDGIRLEGGAIESLNTVNGSSIDLFGIGGGPGGNGVLALTGSPNPSHIRALSGSVSISGEAADSAGVGVWAQAGSTIDGGSVYIEGTGRVDIAEKITTVDGLTDTSVSVFGDGIKVADITTGSSTGSGASSVINISSNGDITTGALTSGDATANGSFSALSWIGVSATGAVSTGAVASGKAAANGTSIEVQPRADSGIYLDATTTITTGAIGSGAATSALGAAASSVSLLANDDIRVAGAVASGAASGGQADSSIDVSAQPGSIAIDGGVSSGQADAAATAVSRISISASGNSGLVPASIDIAGALQSGNATSTTSVVDTRVIVSADDDVTLGGATTGLPNGAQNRNTSLDIRSFAGAVTVAGPVLVTGANGSDASSSGLVDASGGDANVVIIGETGVTTGAVSAVGGDGAIATSTTDTAVAFGGAASLRIDGGSGPATVTGAVAARGGKAGTANGVLGAQAIGGTGSVQIRGGSGTTDVQAAVTATGGTAGGATASDPSGNAQAPGGFAEVTISNFTGDVAVAGAVTVSGGGGGAASGAQFANASGGNASFFASAANLVTIGAGGVAVTGGQGGGGSIGGNADLDIAFDSCDDGCFDAAGSVQLSGSLSATGGDGALGNSGSIIVFAESIAANGADLAASSGAGTGAHPANVDLTAGAGGIAWTGGSITASGGVLENADDANITLTSGGALAVTGATLSVSGSNPDIELSAQGPVSVANSTLQGTAVHEASTIFVTSTGLSVDVTGSTLRVDGAEPGTQANNADTSNIGVVAFTDVTVGSSTIQANGGTGVGETLLLAGTEVSGTGPDDAVVTFLGGGSVTVDGSSTIGSASGALASRLGTLGRVVLSGDDVTLGAGSAIAAAGSRDVVAAIDAAGTASISGSVQASSTGGTASIDIAGPTQSNLAGTVDLVAGSALTAGGLTGAFVTIDSATTLGMAGSVAASASNSSALAEVRANAGGSITLAGTLDTSGAVIDGSGAPGSGGIFLSSGDQIIGAGGVLDTVGTGSQNPFIALEAVNGIGTPAAPIQIAGTGGDLWAKNTGASGDLAFSFLTGDVNLTDGDLLGFFTNAPAGTYYVRTDAGSITLGFGFTPNNVALLAGQNVTLEAPAGSINVDTGGSIAATGGGNITLSGFDAGAGYGVRLAGSLSTDTGTLAITSTGDVLATGASLSAGNATVALSQGSRFRIESGTTTLATTQAFQNTGALDIAAGATLATSGQGLVNSSTGIVTGSGSLDLGTGTLTNDGVVQPGSDLTVGTLTITGNYAQGSGGTLEANLESATSYDVLAVSGTATLGGTLNVSFLNGYTPAAGNAHNVVTYAALTPLSQFSTINDTSSMVANYGSAVFSLTLAQILLNEWINALGGDWAVAANWSLGHVPTASEDVQIADLTGTETISILGGSQAAKSFTFLGDEVLQLTGGSLAFSADSSLQNLDLAGGTLSGTNLVVTNGITQTSGALSLSGTLTVTQAVGDLTLAGANSLGGFGANAAGNILLANNSAALALGPISTTGILDVSTTGSITGAGLVQASDISLSSVNGIAALTTQTNGLAVSNVNNTVDIRNTGVLALNSVSNTNGDFLLDNVGDVSVLSPEQVGGVFRIGAHSSIDVQQSITANTTGTVSGTAIALSSDANVTQAAGATLDAGSAALAIDAPGTISFGAVNATAIFINGVCVSGACPAPVVLEPPTLDPLAAVLASTGETSGSGDTLGDPNVGFSLALGGGDSPVQTAALDASGAGGLGLPPNMADILAELSKLRAAKEKALAKAVEILERDPGIADLKPCAGEVNDQCIAPAPEHAVSRGAREAPKLAYLPAIERKVALLIGEGDYRGAIPKLASPAKDVEDIGRLYGEQFGYEVRTLRNASKREIVRELNRLIQESGPGDSVAVFYAGHGQIIDKTGRGYWIPSTASADDPRQWLSNTDIARFLQNIPAKQLLLVSDSCYSGTLAGDAPVQGVAGDPAAVLARRSVTVLSSGGSEPVADSGKDGHSVFAWHFLERLKDVKAWSNGASLYESLAQAVQRDFPQEPQYGAALDSGHQAGGDFLFEVRKY